MWGRTLSANIWILIGFSICFHWILQICLQVLKAWNTVNKNIKLHSKSECNLALLLKWQYFQIQTQVFLQCFIVNAMLIRIKWLCRKTMGNVNCSGLSEVTSHVRPPLTCICILWYGAESSFFFFSWCYRFDPGKGWERRHPESHSSEFTGKHSDQHWGFCWGAGY